MTSPIGGGPPPSPVEQPVIVINIPSPSVFGIVRGLVQVIHTNQAHNYHVHNIVLDRNFRPMNTTLLNAGDQVDGDIPNDPLNSGVKQAAVQPIEGPGIVIPLDTNAKPMKDGKDPAPRQNLPTGFDVPDMTDRSRSKDDRVKYQKIIADMLDRIARLVKEIHLSKESVKQDIKENVIEALQNKHNLLLEATKANKDDSNQEIANSKDVEAAILSEDIHHVELIIENVTADGQIEQIPVERGEIASLLVNLEGILSSENEDLVESLLTQVDKSIQPDADKPSQPTKETDKAVPQKLSKTKAPAKINPAQPAVPGSAQGPKNMPVLPPGTAAAALASYMPSAGQPQSGQSKLGEEKDLRVEQVEKGTGARKFGTEDKETKERLPIEATVAAKVSRKSARQRDVQDIADTATKDQRAKKAAAQQRADDGKIVPVHGKFTVDQLRNIRRRGGKGEGSGEGGRAETHRLIDILYMILCSVVCGAQTIFDITAFIESREKWFSTVLGLRTGLPSSTLITKLIVAINPAQITEMISLWMREAQGAPAKSGLASVIITETFEGLIFGQEKSGASSTAHLCMPRILQFFEMRGVVMMLSEGKASKNIIQSALNAGAHYIYDCGEEAFPGEEEIIPLFESAMENPKNAKEVEFTESYVEGQEYLQLYEVGLGNRHGEIQSVSQVLSEVRTKDGKEETVQYFTSSLPKQSIWLFELLRTQRGLEGKTEWMMNLSMRGKHGQEAAFAAREFLALIRRYAVGLLNREQSFKAPLFAKQQRASKEADYLMKLLKL